MGPKARFYLATKIAQYFINSSINYKTRNVNPTQSEYQYANWIYRQLDEKIITDLSILRAWASTHPDDWDNQQKELYDKFPSLGRALKNIWLESST